MKRILPFVLALVAASAFAGEITMQSARQRWPFSPKVDIDLGLEGDRPQDVVLKATYDGLSTPIEITPEGVDGAVWLTPGFNHLVWDPVAAGLGENRLTGFTVTATLASFDTRKYLVIDLKERSYEYKAGDDAGEVWSEGGCWSNDIYKTRKMVFRRIPAGVYSLGMTTAQLNNLAKLNNNSTPGSVHPKTKKGRQIRISKDFYISIYQITAANQYAISWAKVTGSGGATWEDPTGEKRTFYYENTYMTGRTPKQFTLSDFRGNPTNSACRCLWPQDGHTVVMCDKDEWGDATKTKGSLVGRLRDLMTYTPTPLPSDMVIDLPTQEMWEIASRGGCSTIFSDDIGSETATAYDINNYKTNHIVWGAGAVVGTKAPNNWGIFDPLGIVWEATINLVTTNHFVGDKWGGSGVYTQAVTFDETQTVDPVGWSYTPGDPNEPLLRVLCNNGYSVGGVAYDATPQFRTAYPVGLASASFGGRLAIYLK